MVPIAKAALVTLLLGCGATGTFALANGGFGIGTATENGNEQGSDVAPTAQGVANTAGGNTQEAVSVPEAGAVENQVQVNQAGTPDPNVRDAGTREEKTVDQLQNQGNVLPPAEGSDDSQRAQSLTEEPRVADASIPSATGGNETNEEASRSDEHKEPEVTTDKNRENMVVQQPANAGKEATAEEHPQESAGQTSEDGTKVANAESDDSLQVGDASLPDGQLSQVSGKGREGNVNSEPETKPDQTATNTPESNQVASKEEEGAEHTDKLDSGSSSDSQKNGVDTTISSEGQN